MRVATQMNGRITRLAVGRHLPHQAARVRLTLLYGALFLLSGAALMAISYALLVNAGFVFNLPNGPGPAPSSAGVRPVPVAAGPGTPTGASAQTMTQWRTIAGCMRAHGIATFPEPSNRVPRVGFGNRAISMLSDRNGAILAFPASLDTQSPAFLRASGRCGYTTRDPNVVAAENRQRTHEREQLLLQSGIALAGMSLLSLALGWLMAGRVLQPLEDSYEAQRRFVANASHELRAPLTRQRALIQVALADPRANVASLRTAHERALAAEQHLEEMIDGLLALTRSQAGLERREPLDLSSVATQALRGHSSQLAELDLDVRASLATSTTAGDPRLIERLVANLVDNAVRHNIPGGHLELATGTKERKAFIAIANSGPTVPAEQLNRLFQPFQRLDARTGHNNGHGLGLSIVQAIATAHGAELSAHARPEGGLAVEVAFASGATQQGAQRTRVEDIADGGPPPPRGGDGEAHVIEARRGVRVGGADDRDAGA